MQYFKPSRNQQTREKVNEIFGRVPADFEFHGRFETVRKILYSI